MPNGSISKYKAANYWKDFTKIFTAGDANLSHEEPDIEDFNYVVNYILGDTPSGFFFASADYNKNEKVNVTDAVAIGRVAVNGTSVASAKRRNANPHCSRLCAQTLKDVLKPTL